MTLESQWYFFKTKWDIFNTVGGPFGGPMDLWPPLKIHFKIYFLFFLFFLKISPKGHPVLLSLSFDTIFKRFINNLKQTDKDDPLDDPIDDPFDLDDPLRWPLLKFGRRIIVYILKTFNGGFNWEYVEFMGILESVGDVGDEG